jgi:hypothetical protein
MVHQIYWVSSRILTVDVLILESSILAFDAVTYELHRPKTVYYTCPADI